MGKGGLLMSHLPTSLAAWGKPEFEQVLKTELEGLDPVHLPLQQGLSVSSYAVPEGFWVTVLGVSESGNAIRARVGVFYAGIVAGCSCADDPTPVEPVPEYCVVAVSIDKGTGAAAFALVDEDGEE